MVRESANDDLAAIRRLRIGDDDLSAYVTGALAASRRTEVEGFLACNPDVAARVMHELHLRGRGARQGRRRPWSGLAAAAVACVVSGLAGWETARMTVADGWRENDGGAAPAYVEDALESRAATEARQIMASQTHTPTLDRGEIARTLKLRAPVLPPGWRVIDAQVYPSDDGPALNVVVAAPDGRRLNLFAVRADTSVTEAPVLARRGTEAVAYWEEGTQAFVLMGDNSRDQLLGEARAIASST